MKVPILRISSIPWLNMGNVELIRRFGLLPLRISSSQFWCPEALELVGLGLYYELPLGDNFVGSVRFHGQREIHQSTQVLAFSSLARILGECSTIHSLPALFFFFFKWRLAHAH